jgi:alpha-galactosidase
MSRSLIRLDAQRCCLIIEVEPGKAPVWRHFGAALGATPLLNQWSAEQLRRLPPGSMDRLSGLALWPGSLNGLSGNALLSAHRNGRGAVHELVLSEAIQVDEHSVRLMLTDALAGLAGEIHLQLDPQTGVLSLQSTARNTGSSSLDVNAFACCAVPVSAGISEIGSFHGQWSHEFQWARETVPHAGWQRSNRRGRSSHEAPPACFLLAPHTTDHQGPALGATLAWSSNHQFGLEWQDDGTLALQAGAWLAPGEVSLAPGESLQSPPLLLSYSQQGINGASGQFHHWLRDKGLHWPGGRMRARPVHLNTWEAVYFDHKLSTLKELAGAAAAVGVERFVLDDGWFPRRHNDQAGLGDWWPDPAKYPQGLTPLVKHVNDLGMEFGLWVEPEMVNPDSDLYRAHPDWALQVSGRPLALGRNQLVLDLSRKEVTDYLFDKLNALLSQHPITYLKWDMNRDLAQACGQDGRAAYQAQVPALYALMDRLRNAHPHLEIESCSSGGGRADFGVLQHTHRLWTSDNNDAASRVKIQSGALRLFPPELLGSHVGPAPAHATGRRQSMDFRCAVACFGHMGIEADVRLLPEAERKTLAAWVAFYKLWRGVLHSGQFFQGHAPQGPTWWLALTETQAVLAVLTVQPPDYAHLAPLCLPAAMGSGAWRVKLLREAGQPRARHEAPAPWRDALRAEGVVVSGEELCVLGLSLPMMNPESALYLSLEREPLPTT